MAETRERILLVEDERTIRDLLANVLWAEGYAVDAVATVAEAMVCLDRRRYALVIADWRLPDGDGLRLADGAAAAGIRTLVMSGYLFQMSRGLADRHETLMKPVRPSELAAAVDQVLQKPIAAAPLA